MAPKRSKPSSSKEPPLQDWELEEASWESDVGPAEGEEVGSEEEGSETEAEDVTGKEAEEELVNLLLDQNRRGKLTAKDLCTLAWWAGKAGLQQVGELGMNPQSGSGNFRRHLDRFLRKREGPCQPEGLRGPHADL